MKRKTESENSGSFIGHVGALLYNILKKIAKAIIELIKWIIKAVV